MLFAAHFESFPTSKQGTEPAEIEVPTGCFGEIAQLRPVAIEKHRHTEENSIPPTGELLRHVWIVKSYRTTCCGDAAQSPALPCIEAGAEFPVAVHVRRRSRRRSHCTIAARSSSAICAATDPVRPA